MTRAGGNPWGPLVLFCALIVSLVLSWTLVRGLQREIDTAQLDIAAERLGARVETWLEADLELLQVLAQRLEGDVDEGLFRELAGDVRRRHGEFLALRLVEGDGTTRWREPAVAGGAEADAAGRAPTAAACRRARETQRPVLTPPFELPRGGWAVAACLPCTGGEGDAGFLIGTLRLADLLAGSMDPIGGAGPVTYHLRSGEDLLCEAGSGGRGSDRLVSARRPLALGEGQLTLSASAAPNLVSVSGPLAGDLLFWGAVLLAGLLALCVHLSRRAREAAELAAERFRVLIDNAPEAVVVIDADSGRFESGNRRALELFGLDQEELLRSGPADRSPARQPDGADSRAAFAEHLERAAAGEARSFPWVYVDGHGEELPCDVQLVRLPSSRGRLVRGSIIDARQRRELEERLHRSRAMEAMGQLAGGVAHDFNNLLTAILGAGELLAVRAADRSEERELALEIVQSALRAGELTRQLLAFSRHQVIKPVVLDLNASVRRLLPMLARLLGERVEVRTDLAPGPLPVLADAGQMELVLLNLAINARDAMPEGGRLTLRTRAETAVAPDGLQVVLSVHDEGEGIAPENLERIFHPAFTTKAPGLGTGIGLATVQQIVSQAGGRIEVHSVPGAGSTFEVFLPRAESVPSRSQEAELSELYRGSGTVLLVEDDAVVCTMARRSLEQAGYRVLSAPSAEEALTLSAAHDGPIDVLVTDVVLPRMGGPELVERIVRDRPETATLLVSGYSAVPLDAGKLPGGAHDVLAKPFRPSVFTRKVGELAARAGSARAGG